MSWLAALPLVGNIASSLIQGKMSSDAAEKAGDKNADLQREFAQMGVRWKVADAKAAGISPLAAMGGTPYMASPSYIAGDTPNFSNMGQDISRAIDATRTQEERSDVLTKAQLEKLSAETDLIRSQAAQIKGATNPALPGSNPLPISGQGDSVIYPAELVSSQKYNPGLTAGAPDPAYKQYVFPDGTIKTYPSDKFAQATEDNNLYQAEGFWHGRVAPWILDRIDYHRRGFSFTGQRRNGGFSFTN